MTWTVVFARIDEVLRHPVQLYASLGYGLIFAGLLAGSRFSAWARG